MEVEEIEEDSRPEDNGRVLYESKTTKIVAYNSIVNKIVKSNTGLLPLEGIRELAAFNMMKHSPHPYLHFPRVCTTTPETITFVLPRSRSTLSSVIPTIDIERAEILCEQLYAAINHLHRIGVIHRDIHPNNILYFSPSNGDNFGHIEIADFGSSCILVNPTFTTLKEEAYPLLYRPPEILIGACYDVSADLWAVGCVMAEMFMKTPLFKPKEYDNEGMLDAIFDLLGGPEGECEREFFEIKTSKKIPMPRTEKPWLDRLKSLSVNSGCLIGKLLSVDSWKRGHLRYTSPPLICEPWSPCPARAKAELFIYAHRLNLDINVVWNTLIMMSNWSTVYEITSSDIVMCIWIALSVRNEAAPDFEFFQPLSGLTEEDFARRELDIVAKCNTLMCIPSPIELAYLLNPTLPQISTFSRFYTLLADARFHQMSLETLIFYLQ